MTLRSLLGKLFVVAAIPVALWLAVVAYSFTSPVVMLHYSADAKERVGYFFNEDNDTVKDYIDPGATVEFRTARSPGPDYFIEVSLPLASRDGVEIKPPFSRVDVYIGADTKIARTVVDQRYWARLRAD